MNPRRPASTWLLLAATLLAAAARAGAPGPEPAPAPPALERTGTVSRASDGTVAPAALEDGAAARRPHPATAWQSLRFEGSALVGDFGATLHLAPAQRADGEAQASAVSWMAELRTRIRSSLLADKETRIRAWFDPRTARIDRFDKLMLGPDTSYRRFRVFEDGFERFRKRPLSGEDPRRVETWVTREKRHFIPFDAAEHGCQLVSDPGVLVYLVSFGPGRWGEDPGACVVSGKTLYRVVMRDRGRSSQDVRYRLRGGDASVRDGRARIARYEVVGTPVAGELNQDVMRLEFLVDTENGLPWKVIVHEGPFRVDVKLAEAVLGTP